METNGEKSPQQPNPIDRVFRRIDIRVERTLANPNLTPEQMSELFVLANLSKLALHRGNPVALSFGKQLIELTDPLMVPEQSTGKQE